MTRGEPVGRLEELEDPLLLAQPADEEHVRRLVGLADLGRDLDAVRDHAHVAGAERAGRVGEERRGGDDERARGARAAARATAPRRASSTSVPHTCSTNGFPVASAASADGIQWACTTSAPRAARRAARANEPGRAGRSSDEPRPRRRFWTIPSP